MAPSTNVVAGERARTVPLRVRHFVDGHPVAAPPERALILPPVATDGEAHGVPLASPSEAIELLESCAEGLARWLALGPQRRDEVLAPVRAGLRQRVVELAAAVADDYGLSCEAVIAELQANGERAAHRHREGALVAPQGLGVHLWMVAPDFAGLRSTVDLLALLMSGSTVVMLPAPSAPRGSDALARVTSQSGLTDGALNVIYGEQEMHEALVGHAIVAGVVGSERAVAPLADAAQRFGKPLVGIPAEG